MTEYLSPGRPLSVRVCVCVSVCMCVCLSGSLEAAIFDRFLWNFNYIVLTKIWDDTFLRFWKCCSDDVLMAFSRFFVGVLSRLQFLCNFLQIDTFWSSAQYFVWDCKPAVSVNIFYPIWPPKKTEKPLKQKFVQIQKQNVNSYRFEVADYEYGHI